MRYAIVIEQVEKNYGAYVPDLPGAWRRGRRLKGLSSGCARRSSYLER
jgi:hypothetical protein